MSIFATLLSKDNEMHLTELLWLVLHILFIFPIFRCKRTVNMVSYKCHSIFNTCFSPPQILMSVKHLGSA